MNGLPRGLAQLPPFALFLGRGSGRKHQPSLPGVAAGPTHYQQSDTETGEAGRKTVRSRGAKPGPERYGTTGVPIAGRDLFAGAGTAAVHARSLR